ncbi:MAG TPA: hypothetical protein VES67_11695 [Vicinamibacterales bacterium]|nr:hypothetical protein [Vicinamibacterales bacterium]
MIGHALWLLKKWNPLESDFLACEAIWTIEQLAILLEDREEDARAAREVLTQSIAFNCEQNQELDRLRARARRPFDPVAQSEPLDPAYVQEIYDWLRTRHEQEVMDPTT